MEPPRLAFPVAWTYLYATMGYASHLISLSPLLTSSHPTAATAAHTALSLYYAQFAGNMLWTPLFFGLNRTGLALLDIVGLTGTVLAMTVSQNAVGSMRCREPIADFFDSAQAIAKSVNRTAFLLFLPYVSPSLDPFPDPLAERSSITVRLALLCHLPQRRRMVPERREETVGLGQEG